jgi:diadenylate cyclase
MMNFLIQIGFMNVTIWDILDVLIVGYLLFQIYKLLKGSLGFNIFLGIVLIYILWWVVGALGMPLLTTFLGQFISVGMIALLIVFQPEVRRFLIFVGQGSMQTSFWEKIFGRELGSAGYQKEKQIREIVKATEVMASEKTGALILFSNASALEGLYSSGVKLNADISAQLILSIFSKNSPLHDGATIIADAQIIAASCVLPVSDRPGIPQSLGLRHRAAIGITETANVVAFIVSEESGQISYARRGELTQDISVEQMSKLLKKAMG